VLARGTRIVPVVGARTRRQLAESLGALDAKLSSADLAAVEALVDAAPVAGERYDAHGMRGLDSEPGRGPSSADTPGHSSPNSRASA
jgi:hypothetical protein